MTVSFSELFGSVPSIQDAQSILAQYQRSAVLLTLAKVSAVLKTWRPRPAFEDDRELARRVFRNAAQPKYRVTSDGAERVFFPRVSILAAARLALEVCSRDAQPIDNPAASAQILKVCLMMNELTTSSDAVVGAMELMAHQLPYHNAFVSQRFQADLLRSMELFESANTLLPNQPELLDLSAEFERAIGLSARRFAELCLLVGSIYVPITGASLVCDDPSFFLRRDQFSNTTVTEEQLASFLAKVAKTDSGLATFAKNRGPRPLADTTVFQSYPLIRLPDSQQYYCIDVASLLDKPGRGLYWTLFGASTKQVQDRLGGTYGQAFEAYLHSKVRRCGVPSARYLPDPRFSDGGEVCDGMFVEGNSLVVCEYKSSVLRADAKCSGDAELVVEQLTKKFVEGDDDGRKGLAQLAHGIKRILAGEAVQGLASRKWTKIYPVMVCLDSALTCPGLAGYLNGQFDRPTIRGSAKTIITPLTMIDVEDFEQLLPDIAAHPFDELLDSYYRAHTRIVHDQFVRFRRYNIPFLQDKPQPADQTEGGLRQFFEELGSRIFKPT